MQLILSKYEYNLYAWNTIDKGFSERIIRSMIDNKNAIEQGKAIMLLSTSGGAVVDTLAVADVMEHIKIPVLCLGHAESGGSVLLCMGKKGHRYIGKNALVMIHKGCVTQNGVKTYDQFDAQRNLLDILYDKLIKIYLQHTNIKEKSLHEFLNKYETYLTAEEAVTYGFADYIF